MTQERYLEVKQGMLDLVSSIQESKGPAYCIGSEDRLANFYRTAERTRKTPFGVWSILFDKQVNAIMEYCNDPSAPQSEPIDQRISDAIGYLMLLYGLVKDAEDKVSQGGYMSTARNVAYYGVGGGPV